MGMGTATGYDSVVHPGRIGSVSGKLLSGRREILRRVLFLLVIGLYASGAYSQDAPVLATCDQRPHFIDPPWVDARYYCAEEVIRDESSGEMGFTSLAAAPDGTLYATRPLHGQVVALRDTDEDGLPDKAEVVAEGLTLPNGLAYYAGSLYISGGAFVYRMTDDLIETLIDDLPAGGGFWTGSLVIGPDERLYVTTGAPCDACIPETIERGAILSYDLTGGDRQVIATGLRQPADLAFRNGTLWTVDTASDGLAEMADLDELNRVTAGAHFGWPYCVGRDSTPLQTGFDCTTSTAPALSLPTHSNPLGIAVYDGEAFPHLRGQFLMTLGGSVNQGYLNGFTLVTVAVDAEERPQEPHIILPEIPGEEDNWQGINLQKIHYQASGFWPRRPFDVTISREGWIYVSSGGGRIWALRPR